MLNIANLVKYCIIFLKTFVIITVEFYSLFVTTIHINISKRGLLSFENALWTLLM